MMRRKDLELYQKRKIKIILKNTYQYTGKIQKINEETLVMLDKFNKLITISISDISQIEDMGGGIQ